MLTTTELLVFFARLYAMPTGTGWPLFYQQKRPRWKKLRATGYRPYNDPLRYK